jgi:hypothetical protein
MRTSIAFVSLNGTLERKLTVARAARAEETERS